MFPKKTSKGEAVDKTPYTSYYPHDLPIEERKWRDNFRQFISIDPARKNLGFRIERRYRGEGTDRSENNIFGLIETLAFDKISVEENVVNEHITYNNTYKNITKFLDDHEEYYDNVHYVIIERQLWPENYQACKIEQHIISYFSIKLQNRVLCPSIISVSSQLKGRMLGVAKGTNKTELKKWAVTKAEEILTEREDQFALDIINYYKKKDDLSDTVVQLEAIMKYWQQNNIEKEAYTFLNFLKVKDPRETVVSGISPELEKSEGKKIIKIIKKPLAVPQAVPPEIPTEIKKPEKKIILKKKEKN